MNTMDWKKPTKTHESVQAGRTDSNAAMECLARNARSANCITALLTMPIASGRDSFSISRYGRTDFTVLHYSKCAAARTNGFAAKMGGVPFSHHTRNMV